MEKTTSKIFGLRAIIEAINSGESVEKVYMQRDLKGSLFSELNSLIKREKITLSYVPVEKLDRLSKNSNHQGVAAQIAPITYHDLDELIEKTVASGVTPLFLILDGISDVRNFGAIIRTAECTGVHGIIIAKHGSAPVNADAVKTSAGAAFKMPICKVDHVKDAVFQFQAAEIQLVAATEKTEDSLYDVDFEQPTAIIMGSEDRGVNPSILKLVNAKAKLPILGTIESLNVSVACGAFLYEAIRQRQFSK
ncbi:MAG: 23S rRNA (guanosine(2251)-2'-O)-methyltransferase RlmB [Flavobacteriaceae bacterium]|nr:MAG: 23S rRNA (guanosine(2251)-2'-O)-methyltransferase RlmB [Flavobacteriaceae bacterium]